MRSEMPPVPPAPGSASRPDISEQLRSFSPTEMMGNIDKVSHIVRKIRLKQGGVGSQDDEVTLYRMMMDLKFMVDIADGLTMHVHQLQAASKESEAQLAGIRQYYEEKLQVLRQKAEANGDSVQPAKVII